RPSRYNHRGFFRPSIFAEPGHRTGEPMSFESEQPPAEGITRDLPPLPGNGDRALAATPTGHPPGLYLLFLVEMWERFSYYGMRPLLLLSLIHAVNDSTNPGRGWSEPEAYLLYGWYTGLCYLTPLIGGFLADRLLGTHRSVLIGGLIIALGHIVLAT